MFALKRVVANCRIKILTIFYFLLQGLFILVFYLILDKTVRNSFITRSVLKSNKLARGIGFGPVMLISVYLCNSLGTQGIQECVHALED